MLKKGQTLKSGSGGVSSTSRGLKKGQTLQSADKTNRSQYADSSLNDITKNIGDTVNNLMSGNTSKVYKSLTKDNPIPHVNPTTAETKKNAYEQTVLGNVKKAISKGKDLTTEQIRIVKKYGLSSIVSDGGKTEYDLFSQNNPQNKARFERVKKIVAKQNKGEKLTEAEQNTLETAKLINEYRTGDIKAKSVMTEDTTENAYKMQDIKAKNLYNGAAYGSDKIKIGNKEFAVKEGDTKAETLRKVQNAEKKADLYINAGLEQYAEGVNTTVEAVKDLALKVTGKQYDLLGVSESDKTAAVKYLKDKFNVKSPEEIAEKPDGAYSTANAMLKQYYTEKGGISGTLNSIIQDVVTNIANNAPGMLVGAATGVGLAGQAVFGISVFGNAYKEAARLGVTDTAKLWLYSGATTASEIIMEELIGGLPGMGGALSGKAVSALSKNVSSAVGKAAIKMAGNALGEFIEEGTQSLLSPVLQKYILGVDVETVADDPIGALSDAAYEGFIGALTAVFTGGISSYAEAKYESNIQANGKYYNAVFAQDGTDIKNVAKFFAETSDKRAMLKSLQSLSQGAIPPIWRSAI